MSWVYGILTMFNLFQSVRSFVRSFVYAWHLKRAFDWTTQLRNRKHGSLVHGSVQMSRSQPSFRHSALLSLGLLGVTRTCADVYCYCLVRGNYSGYRYVGFVSLFGYFSCQRSGLLKTLSLWRSMLLGRKFAWLRHCLIG